MFRRCVVISLMFVLVWLARASDHSIQALTPTPSPTPICEDPTPNGGGEMRFKGIGQLSHVLTRAGDVCPGASETWSFSTVYLGSGDQYVTVQVLVGHGSVGARVKLIDGTEVSLTPGTLYRTTQRYGTLEVIIVGSGSELATYRIQACRSLVSSPCLLSDTVTAKPGDVNCDGRIDARDAFSVLEYDAGLASASCLNVAEVYLDGFINSIDAEILLQYAAGLINRLLPGF